MIRYAMMTVACVALMGCVTTCQTFLGDPEQQARDFAASMGIALRGVECQQYDTDDNGYVSCTLSEATPSGTQLHGVECARAWSLNSGCRRARVLP